MNLSTVDKIANAVLYEGYILYPYRASSRKNRQRFTFGRVYPRAYGIAQNGAEPSVMKTECLARSRGQTSNLAVRVRFLHPMARAIGLLATPVPELPAEIEPGTFSFVPELRIGDKLYQAWQEAVEREVRTSPQPLESLADRSFSQPIQFPSTLTFDPIRDLQGQVIGAIVRRQQSVQGMIDIAAQPIEKDLFKISVTGRKPHLPGSNPNWTNKKRF